MVRPGPKQPKSGGKTRGPPAPELACQHPDGLLPRPWPGSVWRQLTLSRVLYQKAWGHALAFQQK